MSTISSTHSDLVVIHNEKTDMYLVAALMNVYNEAIRRKCKRILWGERDVDRFLSMARLVLDVNNDHAEKPPARSHDLTDAERAVVLDPNLWGLGPDNGNGQAERTDTDGAEVQAPPKPEEVKGNTRRRLVS